MFTHRGHQIRLYFKQEEANRLLAKKNEDHVCTNSLMPSEKMSAQRFPARTQRPISVSHRFQKVALRARSATWEDVDYLSPRGGISKQGHMAVNSAIVGVGGVNLGLRQGWKGLKSWIFLPSCIFSLNSTSSLTVRVANSRDQTFNIRGFTKKLSNYDIDCPKFWTFHVFQKFLDEYYQVSKICQN